jgi:phosphoribosylamine--glycine ligase
MGAYAPVELYEQYRVAIKEQIIDPLTQALSGQYKGVLYIGLLIADGRPYVLEFNARLGDPETQCILPLLKSDLVELLSACTEGKLASSSIEWSSDKSCCVVAVAKDYPEKSSRGELIELPDTTQAVVFQAGTKITERGLETNGGRIFSVTAIAPDMESSRNRAYSVLAEASFNGIDFRKDIAGRAVATCL